MKITNQKRKVNILQNSTAIQVEGMVNLSEVKINAATAIAAAFGFVIALIWRDIIIGLLKLVGLWQDGGFDDITAAGIGIVVAIVITIVCVLGIVYITKWGGVDKK